VLGWRCASGRAITPIQNWCTFFLELSVRTVAGPWGSLRLDPDEEIHNQQGRR
jgi:hypothetical protein